MAQSLSGGSRLHGRGLSISQSLGFQISESPSPHLSLQSDLPDIRNWFSSYEYDSPTPDYTLLSLELESCVPDELVGGGGVNTDLDKPVAEARGNEEDDCAATVEGKSIAGLVGEDHDEEDIYCREKSSQAGPSQNRFVHFNDHDFLTKLGERQVPNDNDEECSISAPKSRRYIVEDIKGNRQNQKELSDNSNMTIRLKQSSELGCYLLDDGSVRRSDYSQDNTERVSESVHREIYKPSKSSWISTRKRTILPEQRGSRKSIPSLKDKKAVPASQPCNSTGKRVALLDQTNLIPGRWHCPRKSKPNLGPPLKQLRLERWVHRAA